MLEGIHIDESESGFQVRGLRASLVERWIAERCILQFAGTLIIVSRTSHIFAVLNRSLEYHGSEIDEKLKIFSTRR